MLIYRLLFLLKMESIDDAARTFRFASSTLWRHTFSRGQALAPRVQQLLDGGEETGAFLEEGLRRLFRMFAEGLEASELHVTPLGGALFGREAMPLLESLDWGERTAARLLDRLLWTETAAGARRRVHYEALDVEELGRVYESLLSSLRPPFRRYLDDFLKHYTGKKERTPGARSAGLVLPAALRVDRNAVRVGVAALVRAELVRVQVDRKSYTNREDPDLQARSPPAALSTAPNWYPRTPNWTTPCSRTCARRSCSSPASAAWTRSRRARCLNRSARAGTAGGGRRSRAVGRGGGSTAACRVPAGQGRLRKDPGPHAPRARTACPARRSGLLAGRHPLRQEARPSPKPFGRAGEQEGGRHRAGRT